MIVTPGYIMELFLKELCWAEAWKELCRGRGFHGPGGAVLGFGSVPRPALLAGPMWAPTRELCGFVASMLFLLRNVLLFRFSWS